MHGASGAGAVGGGGAGLLTPAAKNDLLFAKMGIGQGSGSALPLSANLHAASTLAAQGGGKGVGGAGGGAASVAGIEQQALLHEVANAASAIIAMNAEQAAKTVRARDALMNHMPWPSEATGTAQPRAQNPLKWAHEGAAPSTAPAAKPGVRVKQQARLRMGAVRGKAAAHHGLVLVAWDPGREGRVLCAPNLLTLGAQCLREHSKPASGKAPPRAQHGSSSTVVSGRGASVQHARAGAEESKGNASRAQRSSGLSAARSRAVGGAGEGAGREAKVENRQPWTAEQEAMIVAWVARNGRDFRNPKLLQQFGEITDGVGQRVVALL
jgi:hypothetical protein